MASYMNPSKTVTDLLSKYLEFDPEQLKLGIWSGNLALKDVNLREEAIYPHLNTLLNHKQSDNNSKVQDRMKPPLRMKLIQGSIGELSMKIPWKSLVWGQGDVQVDARNIVITLALESWEETRKREGSRGSDSDKEDAWEKRDDKPVQFQREVKQRMIKEAEKRLLAGRNVTGWLRKNFKAEEEKSQKALLSRENLVKEEGRVEKWLKGTTNDFFWRFYCGLQMKIENVKIVIIQDGVEVGVVMPSIQLLAGVSEKKSAAGQVDNRAENATVDSTSTPPGDVMYDSAYDDGEHVDKRVVYKGIGVYVREATSAEKLATRATMIHVNDVTTHEFVIRPFDFEFSYSLFFPYPPEKRRKRKQAKEKAIKPPDESVNGTQSMDGSTASKKRRGKRDRVEVPKEEDSVAPTETTDATSLPVSTPATPQPATMVREQTQASLSKVQRAVRRASIQASTPNFSLPTPPPSTDPLEPADSQSALGAAVTPAIQPVAPPKQKRHARRSSLAAPLMGSSTVASTNTVSQLPPKAKINRQASAPLALPEEVKQQYAASVEGDELTTRFDSRLNVGAIQFVFSTTQYHMLDLFLASSSRMRNGRPSQTVKSVTDDNLGIHRAVSLLYSGNDGSRRRGSTDSMLDIASRHSRYAARSRTSLSFQLESGNLDAFRSGVIRNWWHYAFEAVRWELRERKRLRRMFQERFLSFNWERQRHRRDEYVELFIATNLASQNSGATMMSSLSDGNNKTLLLIIEDELHVEQVLLYRAIARAVHVKGMSKMPSSILDVSIRQERRRNRRELQYSMSGSSSDNDHPLTRDSNESGRAYQPWINMPMVLSVAGRRCEVSRRRLATSHDEFLPQGEPFAKFYHMSRRRGVEESTVGMTIDTRATKATRKARQAQSEAQTENLAMKFSFTATLSKLEFLLIEDEKSQGNHSPASSVGGTDVSGLTDDVRGWEDEYGVEISVKSEKIEDLSSAPIMNSTDFLLFKEPEITLLHLVFTGMTCSALGRSGGSRNLNLKVRSVEGTGYNGGSLLSIGTKPKGSAASIAEVAVMGEPNVSVGGDTNADALCFSLVLQDEERYIQCDSAHVKACMDLEAVSKILKFPLSSPAMYPSNVLPRTGREEALLHVLNQNAAPNTFVFLDSSIRIQGFDLVFPETNDGVQQRNVGIDYDHSWGSDRSSVKPTKSREGARFHVDMIEFYSGTTVAALTGEGKNTPGKSKAKNKTRKLKMLDLEMFEEGNSSLLSYDWIVAANGVDFEVMHVCIEGETPRGISFLEAPVEVEVFGTTNSGSIRDFTRAKREVIVEVSPVDVRVSEKRLRLLSKSVPKDTSLPFPEKPKSPCQPRLDVLSRSLLYIADVTFERVRMSLVTDDGMVGLGMLSKSAQFEEFLCDFLNVVKGFDLGWPNGEALSAGMQICIDRLAGIGFDTEEGWQCANTALLNFLEDMATAQTSNIDANDFGEEQVRSAVSRTQQVFAHKLSTPMDPRGNVDHHLVFDMPSGVSLQCVKLYYDFHLMVNCPAIFVTNGDGIHILRLTPEVDAEQEEGVGEEDEDTRSDALLSKTSVSSSPPAAVSLRLFDVDTSSLFGKGGQSLTILGGEDSIDVRAVESLVDIEIGDAEILFCQDVFDDLLETLADFMGPLYACIPKSKKVPGRSSNDQLRHILCSTTALSALFSSDRFIPFCRFNLNDCMWAVGNRREKVATGTTVSAKSISLLNLTATGQLHPEPISVPPSSLGLPLLVNVEPEGKNTKLKFDFRGIRIVFLRQFLNECLQFFYYPEYGVGLFRSRMTEIVKEAKGGEESSSGTTRFALHFHDCSIIMPKDSESSTMVAIEVSEAIVVPSRLARSFIMPTEKNDLDTGPLFPFEDTSEYTDGYGKSDNKDVSRTAVQLRSFRIFTSIPEEMKSEEQGTTSLESPAFGFFFGIDGRAEAHKPVYVKLASLGAQTAEDEAYWTNTEKASRRWSEATCNPVSLDIIVDYVPYMRLLITDPRDDSSNRVALDVSLSQFCLLLSVWYCNMQQMPVLFPYSSRDFERNSRSLAVLKRFPYYGTDDLVSILASLPGIASETAIKFSDMSLICRQAKSVVCPDGSAITLSFVGAIVHIISDTQGVMRLGAGSLDCSLTDSSKTFQNVITLSRSGERTFSFADTLFGICENVTRLKNDLPLGFQLSILIGPEWSLYNLGMQCPDLVMSDFTTIFRFLDFVTVYFADESYGNPSFDAMKRVNAIKEELMVAANRGDQQSENPISIMDFRCWLRKPRLKIPCSPGSKESDFSVIESHDGLWYRFSSADTFSSQEVVGQCMSLSFEDNTTADIKAPTSGGVLIEALSFGLRINYNGEEDHTDVSVQIPYTTEAACSLTAPGVFADPYVVGRPTVLVPHKKLHRNLGPNVCEITCIVDVLPRAWASLHGLFNTEIDVIEDESSEGGSNGEVEEDTTSDSLEGSTMSFTANIGDLRLFLLDPVLGPHLPVTVVSVAETRVTTSTFGAEDFVVQGQAPLNDLQVLVEGNIWADYFKFGLTRSWEPLLESYSFTVLFEKSRYRGLGLTVSSEVPFHMNISGALLLILDECFDAFNALFQEASEDSKHMHDKKRSSTSPPGQFSEIKEFGDLAVAHTRPSRLNDSDRVAYSLKNMTGQMIRAFRIGGSTSFTEKGKAVINYLDNTEAMELTLLPSVSLIKNLEIVEVEYPGLENSPRSSWQEEIGTSHQVDLQLPGFSWIRKLRIDHFGRRFVDLSPRSNILKEKVREDWRLANVMKLLIEVGLERGGREVAIRSLFSVHNMTTHALRIRLNPDPTDRGINGDETDFTIDVGKIFPIPIVLLENALRKTGNHLGSFWLRPKIETLDEVFTAESFDTKELSINLSTKPVQLAKVVAETSAIFSSHKGNEVVLASATSGVTLSCPVVGCSDEREVAPFCYALEITRSPLTPLRQPTTIRRGRREEQQHGPVAYTINVHAPIIIVNLLPERGRFEIMHAVRRTVLWFADLEPGQQVPVHSVGLDAPLLLFINLHFCCTPVDEGALIHHGTEASNESRDNLGGLKSIGKAGKAVTKQLGKTLTSLGETPDKRGLQKIQNVRETGSVITKSHFVNVPNPLGLDTDATGANEVGGQTYRVDTAVFLPGDCASETAVVDRVGQKLTLQIENIRGGGGHRRISVFAPFWILNSTEHSLRYKQDKSTHFVSGTVLSNDKDGSIPIDGGKAGRIETTRTQSDKVQPLNRGTIFAGTPGALASSVGRCSLSPEEVSALVDKNMPLERMARLAFMFNFHENSISGKNLCIQLYDGTGQSKYRSEWSRGLSLASVGFSQIVEMHCADGRALELTVVVQTAPGALSGYTKIVHILPRYIAVNHLSYPARLWQDNSSFRPPTADVMSGSGGQGSSTWKLDSHKSGKNDHKKVNQYESLWGREVNVLLDERNGDLPNGTTARETALYITSLPVSAWRPFNLPDSRRDRQLRIGQGALWNLTSSISADSPGEHTFRVSRATDVRLLKHVSTRASPQYTILLPPTGESSFDDELGIWFETEWGSDRSLIVKAVKEGSYCFNKTDVRVGDELLSIDGAPVSRMSFADAMGLLRSRLAEIKTNTDVLPDGRRLADRVMRRRSRSQRFGKNYRQESIQESQDSEVEDSFIVPRALTLLLTFRTAEERQRKVRRKAAKLRGRGAVAERSTELGGEKLEALNADSKFLTVELRPIHNIMFLHLRDSVSVPYEIQNRSKSTTIYFRQRGCNAHPWRSLKPGASEPYTWEEPLKTKRLSLRVDTVNGSEVVSVPDVSEECDPPSSRGLIDTERETKSPKQGRKRIIDRKVRDEEDAVFSPSVNIRLDEIGFYDVIQLQGSSDMSSSFKRALEMEVGVIGATRVLVVQDFSRKEGEDLLLRHLDTLNIKAAEEERRIGELKTMARAVRQQIKSDKHSAPENSDIEGRTLVAARSLMHDFPEERTISGRHQLVLEVLEAVGLSPDSYIGACNPYVEATLTAGTTGRRSLFQPNDDVRRTYFVRKTVNPTWNAQVFIFDVPEEAISVTRGHSLKIKVRNFRKVGTHTTLGRTEVDLHSVRNQKPLTGWFPLSGRTGRRELENSNSHWGRGSIRLSVHWIYTTSALLDYFILLSERKLAEVKESIEGMRIQLDRKREEDRKQMELIDGFRAVRLNNLVHKKTKINESADIRESGVLRIFEPVISRAMNTAKNTLAMVTDALPSTQSSNTKTKTRPPPALPYAIKSDPRYRLASPSSEDLEDMIVQKRHALQSGLLNHILSKKREHELRHSISSGHFPLTSFKSWVHAQKLVNDKDFDVTMEKDSVQVRLELSNRRKQLADANDGTSSRPKIECIIIPALLSPSAFLKSISYASVFCDSRRNFERFARCALRVALNPGGWLTIRPIQAKNLPDSSSGMSVKVQYDSKSQSTETVDSTVFPTWFKGHSSIPDSPRADAMEYLPGDLHFYIPPQQTNGYLRLSVNAESRHQGIAAKTEIGVLQIPLGGAIAACVNAVEEFLVQGGTPQTESPIYIRWFPLKKPQDEVPVEGDQLFGRQTTESEKLEPDQFGEYFTPCIQLALIWSPEVARNPDDADGNGPIDGNHHLHPGGVFSSQVQTYFNADLNQISLALIDSQRSTELLSCTLTDVDVRHWVTKAKSRYGVSIGWFQFDQQNESAREPVVLAPTQKGVLTPVLQMLAVKDNMGSKNEVLSFDFIDVSISEFDLSIEERFLFQLYDFFVSLRLRSSKKPEGRHQLKTDAGAVSGVQWMVQGDANEEPPLLSLVAQLGSSEQVDRRVYIQQLCLGVLRFNISYFKGKKDSKKSYEIDDQADPQTFAAEIAGSDAFRRWSQNTSHDEAVVDFLGNGGSSLPSLIASLFPNVSDAPVRLQAKSLNHVFYSPTEILIYIMGFYQTEILRQIYKIIGSLDFVGNPTMVLNSFISGVRDLIVTPSVALIRSPTDPSRVGLGVAKGTLSLFSHSTSGFFAFTSKVSAAAGQGLATISLDKNYRRWHREVIVGEASNLNRTWKRRGVQNIGEMIVRPITDITVGVTSGVTGVIISPLNGFRKKGGQGFALGVVSGLTGVIVKPTVGVLDALSHFTGSIHDIAKSVNVLEKRVQPTIRYRLPYVFGSRGILTPYDDNKARATQLLRMFPPKKRRGTKSQNEIVIHVEVLRNLGVDTYGIVTNLRFLLLRVKKNHSGSLQSSFCWHVNLVGESTISSEVSEHGHNGVALTVNVKKPPRANDTENMDESAAMSVSVDVDPLGFDNTNVSSVVQELDHGHGTSRGKEGELLEWFTVVAEYQHRRQLCRLHNAVSCVSGNLDAVIRGKHLGRIGSSEGYTSFGIFHFEEKDDDPEGHWNTTNYLQESFDSLAWCEEFTTAGPEWLTEAQDVAYKTADEVDWNATATQSPEPVASAATDGKKTARRLTRWLVGRLPTIQDADTETNSYDTPMKFVTTTPLATPDDDVLGSSHDGTDSLRLVSTTSFASTQEENATDAIVQKEGSVDTDSSDFQSCIDADELIAEAGNSSDEQRPPPPERQGQTQKRRNLRRGRRYRRSNSDNDSAQKEELSPTQPATNTTEDRSADEFGEDEMVDTRSLVSSKRIERMENLMEQLMIFSSEQALTQARADMSRPRTGPHTSNPVVDEQLREEVQELRKQLKEQAEREDQSKDQIEGLRSQLESLRQQIVSGSISAYSSTGHHTDTPAPFERIDAKGSPKSEADEGDEGE